MQEHCGYQRSYPKSQPKLEFISARKMPRFVSRLFSAQLELRLKVSLL